MTEQEVVLKTHRFLMAHSSIDRQRIVRLYTDADSRLISNKELAPFQRFSLNMGDFVLHPDLVGQLSDGETILAIEAKGNKDLLKGLIQAEMYQTGFHYSFLTAESNAWGNTFVELARRKNLGVIAVDDDVKLIFKPEARMPLREAFRYISSQMESVIQVSTGHTFYFNAPTHYLAWAIALQPEVSYSLKNPPLQIAAYPMPKEWQSSLSGAKKLKIVSIKGEDYQLTPIGSAIKVLLPQDITEWGDVHQKMTSQKISLSACHAQAAAVLRMLLFDDPMVKLVYEGLLRSPRHSANFTELALVCDQLDHARTPILFLNPNSLGSLSNDKGQVLWLAAVGENYRSTTFMQFKRILQHSGILKFNKVGGTTAKAYDPMQDIWELS